MADVEVKKAYLVPESPWSLLFMGIGIAVFGIILVAWPDITLRVVLLAFGIFALAWGLFQLYEAYHHRAEEEARWMKVFVAVVAIVAGLLALVWPDATERVILVILGIWFILTGFLMLAMGLSLPKGFSGKAALVIFAIIAVGFGLYLLVRPEDRTANEVAQVVVVLIGVFTILEGVILMIYSFMVRRLLKEAESS